MTTDVRIARFAAIGLLVIAALLWLASPIALRAHQERQGCEAVPAAQLVGLSYHDDTWWHPGSGEVIAYAPTEDSDAWSLPNC